MYSLIIFDWDGTLMDSVGHIVESMQSAITELDLPILNAAAIKDIIGLGLPEAVQTLYPRLSIKDNQRLCEAYSRHFIDADPLQLKLFPGVESVLTGLKAEGYQLAVATGKTRKGLNRLLDNNGWHDYFHGSRCADETQSKPHPQMLYELLDEFDCPPEKALMVGDTEFDLAMARRANMDSVGVSYGVHEVERLVKYSPRLVVDRFVELHHWLNTAR